jgi:hypothetical protein
MNRIVIARRGAVAILTAALSLLMSACSMTISTNPNAYPVPSETALAPVPTGAAVSFVNPYPAKTVVPVMRKLRCDLHNLSDTVSQILTRELAKVGVRTMGSSFPEATVRVVNPRYTQGAWTVSAGMTIAVDFANGTTVSGDGDYESGNAMRAFNGAAQRAAINLLQNPKCMAALGSSANSRPAQATNAATRVDAPPVEQRLRELDRLRDQGLVSPEEYGAKRRTIFEAL